MEFGSTTNRIKRRREEIKAISSKENNNPKKGKAFPNQGTIFNYVNDKNEQEDILIDGNTDIDSLIKFLEKKHKIKGKNLKKMKLDLINCLEKLI